MKQLGCPLFWVLDGKLVINLATYNPILISSFLGF